MGTSSDGAADDDKGAMNGGAAGDGEGSVKGGALGEGEGSVNCGTAGDGEGAVNDGLAGDSVAEPAGAKTSSGDHWLPLLRHRGEIGQLPAWNFSLAWPSSEAEGIHNSPGLQRRIASMSLNTLNFVCISEVPDTKLHKPMR